MAMGGEDNGLVIKNVFLYGQDGRARNRNEISTRHVRSEYFSIHAKTLSY